MARRSHIMTVQTAAGKQEMPVQVLQDIFEVNAKPAYGVGTIVVIKITLAERLPWKKKFGHVPLLQVYTGVIMGLTYSEKKKSMRYNVRVILDNESTCLLTGVREDKMVEALPFLQGGCGFRDAKGELHRNLRSAFGNGSAK